MAIQAQIRSIVAGVAELDEGEPPLAAAVHLADALGATLHLVHAFPFPDPILLPPDASAAEELSQLQGEADSLLRDRVQQLAKTDRLVSHAIPGSASEAILAAAERESADLVMVGATQRGALASRVLGTTALRVLRASSVPVLLVNRRSGDILPNRILLATDLSERSAAVHERGLALVATLWQQRDVEIRSLYVAGDDVLLPPRLHRGAMRERAEERLTAFLNQRGSTGRTIQGRVRLGLSAGEILAETKEWNADLLILGTHGRTGVSRFMIGSVAETVLRKAACDVLVFPNATFGTVSS